MSAWSSYCVIYIVFYNSCAWPLIQWRQLVWMQSHDTDVSNMLLPAVHSSACHFFMQSQPNPETLQFDSDSSVRKMIKSCSQYEKKKHPWEPNKAMDDWYYRAGFAGYLSRTTHTCTSIQYTVFVHVPALMHAFLCILYTHLFVAYEFWSSFCLLDNWMLERLYCLKCNSELIFLSYSTITLWQYVTGTSKTYEPIKINHFKRQKRLEFLILSLQDILQKRDRGRGKDQ